MLEVTDPGLLGTVQDAGRPGWGHLGVRRAGAADPLALAAANLLVGNDPWAPALEMTLLGGSYAVLEDVLVGLSGADMGATVPEDERRLYPGASYRLRAGSTLRFEAAEAGARTYLALAGGVAVPQVLGSAATDPIAGFGGIDGRAVRVGDRLAAGRSRGATERVWPSDSPSSGVAAPGSPLSLAVVEGPHREALPQDAVFALMERTWAVSSRADRVGLRLEGEPIPGAEALELISLPMLPGAIQVPANGQPIVLLPDAPTVGGYPVPAVVAGADQHRTGQLRPGDELRFRPVSLDEARRLAHEQEARLVAIARSLS